tara:strand:+ start:181 stop:372 length:192 start_codon:yes stop_codon:yes gene_type:complete
MLSATRKEKETWRDMVIRYAKPWGLKHDVLREYNRLINKGWKENQAAWGALYDWDLLEDGEEE